MPGPVLVMGAGSVGCFVGGRLQAAGAPVRFVGRPRVLEALRLHGLTLTDLDGPRRQLPAAALDLHATPTPGAALVLLCVKSGATAVGRARARRGAARPARRCCRCRTESTTPRWPPRRRPPSPASPAWCPSTSPRSAPAAFTAAPPARWRHRITPPCAPGCPCSHAAGLPLTLHADLRPVLWGKLLLNLNNPVNAMSGLPLRARTARPRLPCRARCLARRGARCAAGRPHRARAADADAAALAAHRCCGCRPGSSASLAARMLRIDAAARSSMADDLALGRPTEVDALCGAVVRLARAHGLGAPLNAADGGAAERAAAAAPSAAARCGSRSASSCARRWGRRAARRRSCSWRCWPALQARSPSRRTPVPASALTLRVARRVDDHHAVLVEQALVAFDQDRQVAAVLERQPGAAVGQHVGIDATRPCSAPAPCRSRIRGSPAAWPWRGRCRPSATAAVRRRACRCLSPREMNSAGLAAA